jgi:hypothetical protein
MAEVLAAGLARGPYSPLNLKQLSAKAFSMPPRIRFAGLQSN